MGTANRLVFALCIALCPVGVVRAQVPPPQEGWPLSFQFPGRWRAPTLADVDGNGLPEVVIGSSQPFALNVFRHDGTQLPGWPFLGGHGVVGTPGVGDIDGDGENEVVYIGGPGFIYAISATGELESGWPLEFDLGPSFENHVALGDLNGDGVLEVIFSGKVEKSLGERTAHVYAYTGNAEPVPGWPIELDLCPWTDWGLDDTVDLRGISTGDLEGDGADEVVVAYQVINATNPSPSPLFVLSGDGSHRAGWPVTVQGAQGVVRSPPNLVDYDGDGELEIIGAGFGTLHMWKADGDRTTLAFGASSTSSSVQTADLDGDGDLEILYASGDLTIVYEPLPPVPVVIPTNSQPIGVTSGDINGDGHAEILFSTYESPNGVIHLLDSETLEYLPGWPLVVAGPPAFSTVTAMGDLDGDGDIELVWRTLYDLVVLDAPLEGPEPPRLEWPMYGAGPLRSFSYQEPLVVPQFLRGDANSESTVEPLADALFLLNFGFLGGTAPGCSKAADVDDDGTLHPLLDALYLLTFGFVGGPPPPAPFPACASDPTPDPLDCAAQPPCP